MSKNPVVHFEMPYKNATRVAEFYNKVFGWKMVESGEEMGHYITADTAETDANRMVTSPGTINGGFYDINLAQASQEPSFVISVDDIETAGKNIEAAGGQLLGEPQDIPGVGKWVSFKDSEGNRASILQAGNQ